GSNIFNLLFILGYCGPHSPARRCSARPCDNEIPLSLLAAVVAMALVNDGWRQQSDLLSRLDAGVLLLCFAGFMYYIFKNMEPEAVASPTEKR
ncbi:MAG: sodium:calcium antiporter, partial [Cytophagales bacterium]|nr:sodium:calcium antiporter [Cytophagales bacterium]